MINYKKKTTKIFFRAGLHSCFGIFDILNDRFSSFQCKRPAVSNGGGWQVVKEDDADYSEIAQCALIALAGHPQRKSWIKIWHKVDTRSRSFFTL